MRRLDAAGYVEGRAASKPRVWEVRHWDKYRPNMFVCETVEEETLSLKSTNCPGHVQIFKFGQRAIAICRCMVGGACLAMSRRDLA